MNAYEIADELDGRLDHKAANMLRQQADRIAELEKELQSAEVDIDVYRSEIAELEKDLEGCEYFLEKQQSAEPIAWTNQKWLDGIAREPQLFQPLFVHGKQTEHNTIPLYTTPQIKERCEPLCKPSVCNCIKKQLNDAIKIIEELRVDADMNYKDYENTYADGWDDAFNNILSALYERHEIK